MVLWKKVVIGVFVALALLVATAIGFLFLLGQSFSDMCGNQILAEYPSPNNKLKAVIFERDCGATTGFSTQVSVLSSASALENDGDNIFVADTNQGAAPAGQGGGPEVQINWLSETRLQIQHHKFARIHRAETKSKGVQVEYLTF